jgi:RimJ/RimL family protein N-acetyltransferase
MNRLYLHTLDWNRRAQRAFQKAGFTVSGTSWRDGHTFMVMEARRTWAPTRTEVREAVA